MFRYILLTVYTLAANTLCGQELSIYVDTIFAPENGQVTVPVKCIGFDEIVGMQFSMNWDISQLTFDSVTDFGLPQLSGGSFGTTQTSDGFLAVIWSGDPTSGGETLADNSTLFSIVFDVGSGCTSNSTFEFSDEPLERLVLRLDGIDLVEVPTEYLGSAVINFCPLSVIDENLSSPTCAGDSTGTIGIVPTGGVPPYEINWDNGETGMEISNLPAGGYTYTIIDAIGNEYTGSVTLADGQSLSISLGPDVTVCEDTFLLVAVSNDTFSSYTWLVDDALLAVTLPPEILATSSGTYVVIGTSEEVCTASDTATVDFPEPITAFISAAKEVACEGDSVAFSVDGEGMVEWIEGCNFLTSCTVSDPFAIIDMPTLFTAVLSNACYTDTASIFIDTSIPVVEASSDTCVVEGAQVNLSVSEIEGLEYQWMGNNLDMGSETSSTAIAFPEENSIYIVTASDLYGCTAMDTVVVEVVENPLANIKIVDLITPNGDGKNDLLYFEGLEKINDHTLTVFNRWGDIVYRKFNYANDWAGTRSGKPLPAGTYYYVLSNSGAEIKSILTILNE